LPTGIAVDWLADNLYWTDYSQNQVWMSHADGLFQKVIARNLSGPCNIVIDHARKYDHLILSQYNTIQEFCYPAQSCIKQINCGPCALYITSTRERQHSQECKNTRQFLCLVTLTFDFFDPHYKWVSQTRGGTLLCRVW